MGSTKVDVPFTNETVDATDPAGAARTVGFLILGFVILMFSFAFGTHFAGSLQDTVSDALGLETDDGGQKLEVV